MEERGSAIGGVIIWSDLAVHACRTWLLFNLLSLTTLFYFLPSFARGQAKKEGKKKKKILNKYLIVTDPSLTASSLFIINPPSLQRGGHGDNKHILRRRR